MRLSFLVISDMANLGIIIILPKVAEKGATLKYEVK